MIENENISAQQVSTTGWEVLSAHHSNLAAPLASMCPIKAIYEVDLATS